MNHTIRLSAFAALLGIAVLATACGSSGGSGLYGSAPASSTQAAATAAAKVGVGNSSLGHIVVDSAGRTLYLFEKDRNHQSMCAGACATYWPPLTSSGTPVALHGANPSLVGTIKRSDGSVQVTYAGHPLYLYVGDSQAGQTNGEGSMAFGAGWDALNPTGAKIEADQG